MSTPAVTKRIVPLLLMFLLALPSTTRAQDEQSEKQLTVQVEPAELQLEIGEKAQLTAKVVDADGVEQETRIFFFSRNRRAVSVSSSGEVEALKAGTYRLFVGISPQLFVEVPVTVPYPPVERVAIVDVPSHVYAGTRVALKSEVEDTGGELRTNVDVRMTSSNASIATIDSFNRLTAHRTGTITVRVEAEEVHSEATIEVVVNPIVEVSLSGGQKRARTGDVLTFEAEALNADGTTVDDAPITFAVRAEPDDDLGPSASAQIESDGRFVAETPGYYTIVASSGSFSAETGVRITPREVRREVELVGQGQVSDVHTSDLWVWQAPDGRDYAVTGTWGANGQAFFWDVTDPANPSPIDTVTVDARTVNDVKVSEDGTVCVISREGASNRRNGLVILDCANPHEVRILAEFDENLTGGVHNVFIYRQHVYALSAGQRYDIINIEDPRQPHRVGSFELDTPGHSIHDVWVEDGIAYSSNWSDGVWMVDVGNGIAGGSPSSPKVIGHYAYPSGWNHAAFPYRDEQTGTFYIIAGDEAFDANGEAMGWVHFIDFTDPLHPQEVARYEVPESGTHNLWVEDDKLYIAYYQGGLRVVDISGDLMGDLYKQGREIARYQAKDPNGKIPNSPMAWGPQPFKGNIFFSDMNSGLWVVKLKENEKKPEPGL
ncbi:MAG: hypothetical protein ACE5G0_03535 [Rhodothermales bacterium]